MKVAIIIYSQSGTTAQVAKALGAVFTEKGHEVDISLLRTSGNVSSRSGSFELKTVPDVKSYDCIIVGGPVMGFRASPVSMKFLNLIGRLDGKKVLCMVTKGLPFLWTGGRQALRAMEAELSLSQAEQLEGEIIFARDVKNSATLTTIVTAIAKRCGA